MRLRPCIEGYVRSGAIGPQEAQLVEAEINRMAPNIATALSQQYPTQLTTDIIDSALTNQVTALIPQVRNAINQTRMSPYGYGGYQQQMIPPQIMGGYNANPWMQSVYGNQNPYFPNQPQQQTLNNPYFPNQSQQPTRTVAQPAVQQQKPVEQGKQVITMFENKFGTEKPEIKDLVIIRDERHNKFPGLCIKTFGHDGETAHEYSMAITEQRIKEIRNSDIAMCFIKNLHVSLNRQGKYVGFLEYLKPFEYKIRTITPEKAKEAFNSIKDALRKEVGGATPSATKMPLGMINFILKQAAEFGPSIERFIETLLVKRLNAILKCGFLLNEKSYDGDLELDNMGDFENLVDDSGTLRVIKDAPGYSNALANVTYEAFYKSIVDSVIIDDTQDNSLFSTLNTLPSKSSSDDASENAVYIASKEVAIVTNEEIPLEFTNKNGAMIHKCTTSVQAILRNSIPYKPCRLLMPYERGMIKTYVSKSVENKLIFRT